MFKSGWCNQNLNAVPMEWKYVKGEVVELIEAIVSKDLENFKEEIGDVMYTFYCALHTSTGISLPMIGAGSMIAKVLHRLSVWNQIFIKNGLVFDKKYLVNGSNYEKESKVKLALDMAKRDQNYMG